LAKTYRSTIPEPYQTIARGELRKLPTSKLQEAYNKLKAGESTGIELVERNRAYAISAIEEALWERGKLHSSGGATGVLPILGIGALSAALGTLALARSSLSQRAYRQDGQCLVSVRYPGEWHDLREFVQPDNPNVAAIYSQFGPNYWSLYDFVCRNIDYRRDIGEFWQTPPETLARGEGDCEDSSILLTSLLRNFTNAKVALGAYQGYGHAWCEHNGQVIETTYTSARPVPAPQAYCPYCMFNESEVIELWPGALSEVFGLRRDEATKLNMMAEVVDGFA